MRDVDAYASNWIPLYIYNVAGSTHRVMAEHCTFDTGGGTAPSVYIGPPATAPNTPGTTNVLIALSRIANLAPAQLVYAGTLVCFGPFDESYGPLNTSCN